MLQPPPPSIPCLVLPRPPVRPTAGPTRHRPSANECVRPRRWLGVLALAVGTLTLGSSLFAAAPRGVTLDIVPAHIVRRTFDPARPPADMPKLVPPEVGQCVYEFSCEMETRVERPALPPGRLRATVTATAITTRLNITLWTPHNGPAAVVEHEEAHREIAEHYYRPAAAIARRIGERMVGATITPASRNAADTQAALRAFQDAFIQEYLRETLTRCSFAQERFDAITHHSRAPIGVREALVQSLADEAAHHRSRALAQTPADAAPRLADPPPRKRFPPTRPRS